MSLKKGRSGQDEDFETLGHFGLVGKLGEVGKNYSGQPSKEIRGLCELCLKKVFKCYIDFTEIVCEEEGWVQCDSALFYNAKEFRITYYDGDLDSIEIDLAGLYDTGNIVDSLNNIMTYISMISYEYDSTVVYKDGKYHIEESYPGESINGHDDEYIEYGEIPEIERKQMKSAASAI